MRGWYEWHKFTREGNAAARDLFEQARKIDPNYARAYAGLAWAYADDYDYEWTNDYDKTLKPYSRTPARPCVLIPMIIKLSGHLGGHIYTTGNTSRRWRMYLRARDLNPNDAELLAEMGNFLIFNGQPIQAIDQVKEAIRLNPFHETWYVDTWMGL